MDRSTWIALMVAGFAGALGYGVARGFVELPAAVLVVGLLLLALSGAGTALTATAPVLALEPPAPRLPIGFHPN